MKQVSSKRLHPWVAKFLRYCAVERGLARRTCYVYASGLALFRSWLGGDLRRINQVLTRAYLYKLDQDGLRPRTRAWRLAVLRAFTKFLRREGLVVADPLADFARMKIPRGLPKPIAKDKVALLLRAPNTRTGKGLRDRAVLELLYGSGLRISEATGLDRQDLDLEAREARVTGKGSKPRVVPLAKASAEVLRRHLASSEGKPGDPVFLGFRNKRRLSPAVFAHRIKRYASAAGVPLADLTPHKLRHSFATHLLDAGADLMVIRDLLGHASVGTTQVYTGVSDSRRRSVFDRLNARDHRGFR